MKQHQPQNFFREIKKKTFWIYLLHNETTKGSSSWQAPASRKFCSAVIRAVNRAHKMLFTTSYAGAKPSSPFQVGKKFHFIKKDFVLIIHKYVH